MIAVTGASVTFCRLPSRTRGFSRSFAAGVVTNTMRTGKQFALGGPQRIRSYRATSCSRETGLSDHLFLVRALRKIVSSAESSSCVAIRCASPLLKLPFLIQVAARYLIEASRAAIHAKVRDFARGRRVSCVLGLLESLKPFVESHERRGLDALDRPTG